MKRLIMLGLFCAFLVPVPAHAATTHFGCCTHRFRLVVRISPSRLASFALVDLYSYGTANNEHPLCVVQTFCGPAHYAHRP